MLCAMSGYKVCVCVKLLQTTKCIRERCYLPLSMSFALKCVLVQDPTQVS